jgi:hypothetical protein
MATSDFSPGHRALPRIFANPKESQLAEITQLLFQSGSETWRAPCLWRPLPASLAGGAEARPDHPISRRWMFGRIFGLDGHESYRELRLGPLILAPDAANNRPAASPIPLELR